MLKDAKAFSSFAVDDVPRAKEFYGTTLGLEVVDVPLGVEGADVPAGLDIHLEPGTRIGIYPKPDHTPAVFTILNFMVEDIERAVDELTARGVRFEHYETDPKTDAKGIHRTPEVRPVAWFRDASARPYPDSAYRRLVQVKRRYDPTNLFHRNLNIRPA